MFVWYLDLMTDIESSITLTAGLSPEELDERLRRTARVSDVSNRTPGTGHREAARATIGR